MHQYKPLCKLNMCAILFSIFQPFRSFREISLLLYHGYSNEHDERNLLVKINISFSRSYSIGDPDVIISMQRRKSIFLTPENKHTKTRIITTEVNTNAEPKLLYNLKNKVEIIFLSLGYLKRIFLIKMSLLQCTDLSGCQ